MKKILGFIVSILCFCTSAFASSEIEGFWKIVDEDTGKPDCIVAIYEYKGKHYGRLIATYDDAGEIDDTIYDPVTRAPGVVGNPFYSGLELVYNLRKNDLNTYKGKIIDPNKGKVYSCEVWREGENLIVRGQLFIFGKNMTWPPARSDDFPEKFKLPDPKTFVPVIPKVQ